MIAIDTNVLLRYLLHDDELQARKATALITGDRSVFISHVVLVETAWTLVGKRYKLSCTDIVNTFSTLFEEENVILQDAHVVWSALADYHQYGVKDNKVIDFPDALIFHTGKDAADYFDDKFEGFYTFDKAARVLPNCFAP